MSASVEATKDSNVKTTNSDNKLTIDFETITQTTSKASIPTGPGMNAIAKLGRSASDAKKDTNSSKPIPGLPVGSADGNIQAEASATPEDLEAHANSLNGDAIADVKASYGTADATSSDKKVHAQVNGFNAKAEADHSKDGQNTAKAETKGIAKDGETPSATADATPGVDEAALWKAKF